MKKIKFKAKIKYSGSFNGFKIGQNGGFVTALKTRCSGRDCSEKETEVCEKVHSSTEMWTEGLKFELVEFFLRIFDSLFIYHA